MKTNRIKSHCLWWRADCNGWRELLFFFYKFKCPSEYSNRTHTVHRWLLQRCARNCCSHFDPDEDLRGSQRVGLFLKSRLVTMKAFYSPCHGCLVLFWRTLAVKEEAETIPFHACKEPLIIYSEYNILKHPTSTCGQQTKRTLQHFVFRNDKNTFLDRKVRATPQPHPVLSLVLCRKCWSADKKIPATLIFLIFF